MFRFFSRLFWLSLGALILFTGSVELNRFPTPSQDWHVEARIQFNLPQSLPRQLNTIGNTLLSLPLMTQHVPGRANSQPHTQDFASLKKLGSVQDIEKM